MEPWNRQPTDTVASFRGFTIYRDLGPTRSLQVAANIYSGKPLSPIGTFEQLKKWSAANGWVARTQAWDSYLDDQTLALVVDEVTAARARHAAAAQVMVDKVADRLGTIDPDDLTIDQLGRWLDIAVKVERLALGDAGQIIETREVDTTDDLETRRALAQEVIAEALERMSDD